MTSSVMVVRFSFNKSGGGRDHVGAERQADGERERLHSFFSLLSAVKGTVPVFLSGCLTVNQQDPNWCRWTLRSSVTFRVCMFKPPPSSSSSSSSPSSSALLCESRL